MIRVRQINVLVEKDSYEHLKTKIASKLKVKLDEIKDYTIIKQSVDARHKPEIYFSYTCDVNVLDECKILNQFKNDNDVTEADFLDYTYELSGTKKLNNRPVIVGSGPCGIFCAYMLAENGYKPLIIERGKRVEDRTEDIENFWKTGVLNTESNVQFGEGGAGTFSDGKLNTMVKDKLNRQRKVFEIFVENGAPKEILYEAKPHIGTDNLRVVVKNMRDKIIEMGGEYRFEICLTNIIFNDNKIEEIEVNHNEKIKADILVLAIGHSARDTFKMLFDKKINMTTKPFAVGVRVQHSQKMINKSQYGTSENEYLKEASYKLTHTTKDGRGVYTFCMCPGGFVVNASSENECLAVNGMSNYKRDSGNANSAVIVTVSDKDFGNNPMDGIEFQRKLERNAHMLGNGKIPVSLLEDYLKNSVSKDFGSIKPVMKGEYVFANLNKIFPDYINDSLKEGIIAMDSKIKGFASPDTILAGVESRTSSPVKIVRDEAGESNIKGLYPSGEGAGYAGGITSAAIDGLVTFEKIISTYKDS